ncbi:hypothetical protein B0H14DRAFT_2609167 [Mycena olivaceomarginata]|nr:hypothetical protein B0H14DRAFT_2609167 [Mycena olivaceomarginata]
MRYLNGCFPSEHDYMRRTARSINCWAGPVVTMDRNLPRNEHPSKVPFATSAAFNDMQLQYRSWDGTPTVFRGVRWEGRSGTFRCLPPRARLPMPMWVNCVATCPIGIALTALLRDRRSQRSTIAPRPPYPPPRHLWRVPALWREAEAIEGGSEGRGTREW